MTNSQLLMKMNRKPFTFLASAFLAVITILHILRIVGGWEVVIDRWHVPPWVNAILAIVTGTLALMLWKENRPNARIMKEETGPFSD